MARAFMSANSAMPTSRTSPGRLIEIIGVYRQQEDLLPVVKIGLLLQTPPSCRATSLKSMVGAADALELHLNQVQNPASQRRLKFARLA